MMRVRDDERRRALPPQEEQPEDEAHGEVGREAAEALVEVVAAAYGCRHHQCPRRAPAQLAEPVQQVAEHQDFFDDAVLRRGQDQDRDAPPDVRQVFGHHRQVGSGGVHDQVEGETDAADHGSDGDPAQRRRAAAGWCRHRDRPGSRCERIRKCATSSTGTSPMAMPVSCSARSSHGPSRRLRTVEQRGLRSERLAVGQVGQQVQQRVDPGGAEREAEDQPDLLHQPAAGDRRHRIRARPAQPTPQLPQRGCGWPCTEYPGRCSKIADERARRFDPKCEI